MKKMAKLEYNRLELVLMAMNKLPYILLKETDNSTYCMKEYHYLTYEKELTTQEIHNIIRFDMRESPLIKPSIHNKLVAAYYFKHIDVGHEEEAIIPLTVAEESKGLHWDIWGVLDDGSILNTDQAKLYLNKFQGNKYNEYIPQVYNLDTESIED